MARPPASLPSRGARLAAWLFAGGSALLAGFLALEIPSAYADPATYESVYRMRSGEGPYRSIGHYALVCGLQALALGAVAVVAGVYARTGRWRRAVLGAAVVLAALAAWRAATWAATGFDH